MAKVSPVSIKYMVTASFKAQGPLEKPDVIGALFGQTEGLLGEDLEMRELQKEGKIGRIEVSLQIVDGRTVGQIEIPTALDKSETTLIGAAIETIDRIGPTEAQITIEKIKDVRADKRDFILQRAKKLLERMDSESEFEDMAKSVKEESRAEKIQEYGEEKLPAGDLSSNEIIVVEGRADVVNLLKNRIANVIGMNGTKLPKEIAILGKQKEITLFIDGDRGGRLIADNVINHADVKYVAVAPDGKEVEELTGKELIISLRKKVPVSVFLRKGDYDRRDSSNESETSFEGDIKKKIKEEFESLKGTKSAALYDSNMSIIRKVSVRDIPRAISGSRVKVMTVIADGPATGAIIRVCDEMGVKYLGATTFSSSENSKVELISL